MNQDHAPKHRVLFASLRREWLGTFGKRRDAQFVSAVWSTLHDCRRRALAGDDHTTVLACDGLLAEVEQEVRPWRFC